MIVAMQVENWVIFVKSSFFANTIFEFFLRIKKQTSKQPMWNNLWQMVISALGEFLSLYSGKWKLLLQIIICYFSELPARNYHSYKGLGWEFFFSQRLVRKLFSFEFCGIFDVQHERVFSLQFLAMRIISGIEELVFRAILLKINKKSNSSVGGGRGEMKLGLKNKLAHFSRFSFPWKIQQ